MVLVGGEKKKSGGGRRRQRDRSATPDCVFKDDTARSKCVNTPPVREKRTSGRTVVERNNRKR